MIKRFFYIFSTTLFILTAPNMGLKAKTLEKHLLEMEQQQKAPPGFNYQAVLRGSDGNPLTSAAVTMRLTIQTAANGGTIHWQETHNVTTNEFGLLDVVAGSGTQTGGEQTSFEGIPWQASDMFLKVEVDQGAGFDDLGTSQFQSVPYAAVAGNGLSQEQADKLHAVSLDAEANVQADWSQADNTQDDFIKNKPTLAAQIQSDWNQVDNAQLDFIQNKPTIPTDVNDLTDTDGLLAGSTFDGSFNSLSDVPANLDTDATNDFSGAFGDLSGVPVNLDTDNTDDFSGVFGDLSGVPVNLDTDATDDFDGAFGSLSGVPVNLDTDATDDFSGNFNDLTNRPTLAFTTAANLTSNAGGDLATDSFVFGSPSMNDDTDSDHDLRIVFDKSNGSFRAGGAQTTEWDTRGAHSTALGQNNSAVANWSSITGGRNNTVNPNGSSSFIGGGSNNQTGSNNAFVGAGGYNNASGSYSVIVGGSQNSATQQRAAIVSGRLNSASGSDSFIGGGHDNTASGTNSVIVGGYDNTATANSSVVAGGDNNDATGIRSIVGGGGGNLGSGNLSTIGGGSYNTASATYSTIPGGRGLKAESLAETALGMWNTSAATSSATSFNLTDRLLVIGNGMSGGASASDALVMLKNGNTTLNGQLTITNGTSGVAATSSFTLPNTDGSNGQALITNGSGTVSWQNAGAFSTASNLTSNSGGTLATDSFLFGSSQLNDGGNSDHDNRMFFEKNTGAFRVGSAIGTEWDTRGEFSFAAGRGNKVTGKGASISGGSSNIGYGNYSIVGGGKFNRASEYSAAVGGGFSNRAYARSAFVGGGRTNNAYGRYSSIIGGRGIKVQAMGEVGAGLYSTDAASSDAANFVATDRLFVIGNGSSSANTSNAFVMLKNGNSTLNGQLTLSDGANPFTLPNADGAATYVLQTNGSGSVTWVDPSTLSSDKRLKTNIRDLTNVLEKLTQLEGYKFNWNDVQNRNQKIDEIGLIAQDVRELYPELVSTDEQGYLRVKYTSFIPLLIEAISELKSENESLMTQNQSLKANQDSINERFTSLEDQVKKLINIKSGRDGVNTRVSKE
ncbi:MAG: tail fiber domain-containing protein [Cyclobacteriaceae bacterium]